MNDYPPTITDDEVARLPVHAGRADLLEEIMITPVVEQLDNTRTRRRPTPDWFAVPAAAAAVVAIAMVPVVRDAFDDPSTGGRAPIANQPSAPPRGDRYVALDAPGWTITHVGESEGLLGVSFENGQQSLELVQRPAEAYPSYYEDRVDVSDPAETVLLGEASSTFTYSADDHATIRPVEGESFLEVRGSGMDLAAYDALLAQLVQTYARGFADAMPDDAVTPFNRDRAVARLLEDVTVPDGFTAADVEIEGFHDAYQAALTVAGSVGCAWLDVYAEGGQAAAKQQVLAALDGSVDWPLLKDSAQEGDYPEVFWGLADELRAGKPVDDVRHGIC